MDHIIFNVCANVEASRELLTLVRSFSMLLHNFDLLIKCFFKCKVLEESFKWIYVGDKRELSNSIVEGFNSENRTLY